MPDIDHPRDCNCSICDLSGVLLTLRKDRQKAIRAQNSGNQRVEDLILDRLGGTTDLTEAERKRLWKLAKNVRVALEERVVPRLVAMEKIPPQPKKKKAVAVPREASAIIDRVQNFVTSNILGRVEWDKLREGTEWEMAQRARQLPVWPWVSEVRGVSELGLGVIVGHGHNLSRYPTKGHLYSRLMVGLRDWKKEGNWVRQGFVPANLSREERKAAYIHHAYNPQRLGDLYPFLYDSLIRAQWRSERGCVPKKNVKKFGPLQPHSAHALGPYGTYYADKKAEYLGRYADEKGGADHADIAARRYAAKMFIRDLWRAWKEAA
jgi:hypothetical protein